MHSNLTLVFVILLFGFTNFVSCQSARDCNDITLNCQALIQNATSTYPNYADLRTPGLIKLFGYPVEEHKITTDDGYILTVYRIPYSNRSAPSTSKIPVFLMHGLLVSSAQWFWQPAERALVFMLVDAGYDVWIGNARGTSYSQGHLSLPTDDPANLDYWNFSSYEMGKYDVPAYINYITGTTGQPSIYYIGHSLGGCQFFIAMTLHPELNDKVRTMFALAPAVYTGNTKNALVSAAAVLFNQHHVEIVVNRLEEGSFIPSVAINAVGALTNYCINSLSSCGLCISTFLLTGEFDPCQTNFTTLPGLSAHLADQISVKTFFHSSQAIVTGKFRQYDYGLLGNVLNYGSPIPPDYNWSNLHVPILLYSGQKDDMVAPEDLEKLADKLGRNLREYISIPYKNWTHFDFIIGKDADTFVYNHILDTMNLRIYG